MAVKKLVLATSIALVAMVSMVSAFQVAVDSSPAVTGAVTVPGVGESGAAGAGFQHDDGSAEVAAGLVLGGELAFFQSFDAGPAGSVITHVDVSVGRLLGTPFPAGAPFPAGGPLTVYVWDDPDNDGDPSDAVLLGSGAGLVSSPNSDTFIQYDLEDAAIVTNSFFVGAMVPHISGEFPAALDLSVQTFSLTWYAGETAGSFNPLDLSSNTVPPTSIMALGFTGVWMVRAGGVDWADLGHALPGSGGAPQLAGTGTPTPGQAVTLSLSGAAPHASCTLVAGLSPAVVAFKGGVLVPAVDDLVVGLTADGAGNLSVSGRWPASLAPGQVLYFQYWINDLGAPAGFAASNGLAGTTE